MNEVKEFMPIVLYMLSSVLLVFLILLVYKVIKTLEKVDMLVDDFYQKSQKLNFVFTIIERLELLNEKIVQTIISVIAKFFEKRSEKKKKGVKKDES